MRTQVYCLVASEGKEADYRKLKNWLNATIYSQERTNLYIGLAHFEDTKFLNQNFEYFKTELRTQDYISYISYLLGAVSDNKDDVWQFIKEEYDVMRDKIGTDLGFSRLPVIISRYFVGKDFIKDYKAFFKKHLETSIERSFKQGVEVLEYRQNWLSRDFDVVKLYLENNG